MSGIAALSDNGKSSRYFGIALRNESSEGASLFRPTYYFAGLLRRFLRAAVVLGTGFAVLFAAARGASGTGGL